MKKKYFICIACVICFLAIFFIISNNNDKKLKYTVEKIEKPNYFMLMENNKYGVIDKNGNVVINPIYDVVEIPNPSKDVFICKKDFDTNRKEYRFLPFGDQISSTESMSIRKWVDNSGTADRVSFI